MEIKYLIKPINTLAFIGNMDLQVKGISYNSRNVKTGDLFVAIKGFNSDGHQFLNDAQLVEDSFYNSVIQRYRNKKNIMQFVMHSERSLRKQFTSCTDNQKIERKREREEKVSVTYLPHYEWSTGHYEVLPHLFYRQGWC